jgi:putative flippase GtrA
MSLALKLETYLKRTSSITRFLLVGIFNTLIGLSIMFMLLNVFSYSYWISTLIGNIIGSFVSYLLNRKFTFQSKVRFQKGVPLFIMIIFLCYLLAYSVSDILAKNLYHSGITLPLLQQDELAIVLGSVIYTISNYIGQRYIVFRK